MNDHPVYQDEIPEERIDGKRVVMSPRPAINHTIISGNILFIFGRYLDKTKCDFCLRNTDLFLTPKDCFVPDFMIVCDRDKIKMDGVYGAPDLVVEVLSPSTAKLDKGYKKDIYERCGVREYWIISPEERSVEQYWLQDGCFVLHEVYTVYPDWMLAKMTDTEKADVITHFKCSLYDDLVISLDDIFNNMFSV